MGIQINYIFKKKIPGTAIFFLKFLEPVIIQCDNTSTTSISENLVFHSKTKHIYIYI